MIDGVLGIDVSKNTIDVSMSAFVATQLGAREVPNLSGIDDADDVTSLV